MFLLEGPVSWGTMKRGYRLKRFMSPSVGLLGRKLWPFPSDSAYCLGHCGLPFPAFRAPKVFWLLLINDLLIAAAKYKVIFRNSDPSTARRGKKIVASLRRELMKDSFNASLAWHITFQRSILFSLFQTSIRI